MATMSTGMLVPWADLVEIVLLIIIVVMVKRK